MEAGKSEIKQSMSNEPRTCLQHCMQYILHIKAYKNNANFLFISIPVNFIKS